MTNCKNKSATATDKNMRIPELAHKALKHVALSKGITMRELFNRLSIRTIREYNQDMEKLTRH